MHHLFESLSLNILILDITPQQHKNDYCFEIKYLNKQASQFLGYLPEELQNKAIYEITDPEVPADFWDNAFKQYQQDKAKNPFPTKLLDKNNNSIDCLISFSQSPSDNSCNQEYLVFFQNNKDLAQCEQNLAIMRLAIEQSVCAVMITDAKGRIVYINPKFIELTGFSKQELLGSNPRIFQSGYTSPEQYQAMWESLTKTGQWQGELKNRKKNGEIYWIKEKITAIRNNRNEITHYLSIEEDVTQNRQVKSALTESEARFSQMADMTGEWLWEQDPQGFYIYSSIAVKKILGYLPEEVLGKHYSELLALQDKQKHTKNTTSLRPFYSLTNYYQHKDGHQVITESTGLPIKNHAGKVTKWRGVDRDITAQKHFQDALIESEKRTRLIIESALNAIVIIDSYCIIDDWNHHAEKMFGWSHQEAIGRRIDELIIPTRLRPLFHKEIRKFLKTGKSKIINKRLESFAIRRNGSEFPVEFSLSPLKLGNAFIFSGFIHDITARRKAEQQIRQAQINLAITQSEFKIAHQIQSTLLPSAPIHTSRFEITGLCLPADQVGGDYFDYFYREKKCLDFVIADVSGHSIGPALFMVETRSVIRAQLNKSASPAETLDMLNSVLFHDLDSADYFITLFYCQYFPDHQQLLFANAGHPPPLIFRHGKKLCTQLDAEGLVLGVRKRVIFEEKKLTLENGDLILLYTDGLTETENQHGDFFGIERVCHIISSQGEKSPKKIIDTLLYELKQFKNDEAFIDDITLMILKII